MFATEWAWIRYRSQPRFTQSYADTPFDAPQGSDQRASTMTLGRPLGASAPDLPEYDGLDVINGIPLPTQMLQHASRRMQEAQQLVGAGDASRQAKLRGLAEAARAQFR